MIVALGRHDRPQEQSAPPEQPPRWRRRRDVHHTTPAEAINTASAGNHWPVMPHPTPDNAPAASSSGNAQQATHAAAASPAKKVGNRRRVPAGLVSLLVMFGLRR
jgi:hypothetical protein